MGHGVGSVVTVISCNHPRQRLVFAQQERFAASRVVRLRPFGFNVQACVAIACLGACRLGGTGEQLAADGGSP